MHLNDYFVFLFQGKFIILRCMLQMKTLAHGFVCATQLWHIYGHLGLEA